MILGTIEWVLWIATYLVALAAVGCAAIALTLAAHGRFALVCWGLAAWMLTSPILWSVLYVPIHWNSGEHGKPWFVTH